MSLDNLPSFLNLCEKLIKNKYDSIQIIGLKAVASTYNQFN